MSKVQLPGIVIFSILIAFFGMMDFVRSAQVFIGSDFGQFELAADFPCNPHQEEGESEKESKSGEENESKESKKKKVLEVDDCDAFGSENARNVQLKSGHRLGNSSSSLALAAARIWEPPEMG